MSSLLKTVLTDASARSAESVKAAALANSTNEPWDGTIA